MLGNFEACHIRNFNIRGLFLEVSWPSCPKSLFPHENILPLFVNKRVCCPPNAASFRFPESSNCIFCGELYVSTSSSIFDPPKPDKNKENNCCLNYKIILETYRLYFMNLPN